MATAILTAAHKVLHATAQQAAFRGGQPSTSSESVRNNYINVAVASEQVWAARTFDAIDDAN